MTRQRSMRDTRTDLLNRCLQLFADNGYAGTSMRDIARAMDLSVAAVYHHFPSKKDLYQAVAEHAFAEKATPLQTAIAANSSAEERLQGFVSELCQLMSSDKNFHRFLARELLDADTARLELLSHSFFHQFMTHSMELVTELAPDADAYTFVNSLFGMVLYHFQLAEMHHFLPGRPEQFESADFIAQQVTGMLLNGIERNADSGRKVANLSLV